MSMSRYAQNRIATMESALADALDMLRAIQSGKTFPAPVFYERMAQFEQARNPLLLAQDDRAIQAFFERDPDAGAARIIHG